MAALAALTACGGGSSSSPGGTGITVPSAPTGLQAGNVTDQSVSLAWTSTAGATGYTVLRNGATLAPTGSPAYVDATVAPATTYAYTVIATNSAGSSPASAALSVTTPVAPPATPAGLAATTVSATAVTLSWSTVAGATGYTLARNGTPIATPTNPGFTDAGVAPGTTYSYTVTAANGSGSSAPSAPLSVTTPVLLPATPATPTGLVAIAQSNTAVSLQWTAVGPTLSGAVSYRLYRDGALPALTTTTQPSYVDDTPAQASTHSYTVQAFDAAGHTSAQTAAVSVTTLGPTAPSGLAASPASNTRIALSWAASSDVLPLLGYRILRNGVQVGSSTGLAYSDTSVAQATGYRYTVVAYDASYSSAPSNTATAQTPGPTAPVLGAPTVTGSSVHLSWSAATDSLGATSYTVLRSQGGAGAVAIATTSSTTYTDNAFAGGGQYTYTVRASDGTYTATSNAVTATVVMAGTSMPVVLTPSQVALTQGQTQQLVVTFNGQPATGLLTYAVDGVAGGSTATGTISATGLYIAPASTTGTHLVSVVSAALPTHTATASVAVTDLAGIYTYHGDNTRSGQYAHEYALNPTNLRNGGFGKLFTCNVDGQVYATPLYAAHLSIGGGVHNVVFVATEHDSVYAIDADSPACVVYWKKAYVTGSVTSGPVADLAAGCDDIHTEIGITGTPVIDPVAGIIYFVAVTKESGSWVQRLHALDLATGSERMTPVSIQSNAGSVPFSPLEENQRPALALNNGQVYIGWASHCDMGTWQGWLMAYDASTLAQTAVFNVAPTNGAGGIWMSGGGPAIDSSNNLYVTTGNGSFGSSSAIVPPLAPNFDFGESFLKLSLSQGSGTASLAVADFYTPSQNALWTSEDQDLSSSGVVVLPDGIGPSAHPNLVTGADKQSHLWLLDRSPAADGSSSMGGFSPTGDNVVQYLTLPPTASNSCDNHSVFSTPSYWNGSVYVVVGGGGVLRIPLVDGLFPANAGVAVPAATSADHYSFPPPTTVISTQSGATTGVLWTLDNSNYGGGDCSVPLSAAVLHAYDATTLAPLYSSATLTADVAGPAIKFQIPVVANGHVYVGGAGTLTVYGLKP